MRIDVFCESGKKYGLGHLRRCENLVWYFSDVFPTIHFQTTFHHQFTLATYPLDIVIVDSYIAPKSFYDAIQCTLLICLDDFNRLIYPPHALILRPTLGAKTFAKTYGGEGYIIINPEFKLPAKIQEQKGRILINLGGSLQTQILKRILSSISGDIHIINPYFKHPHYPTYHSLTPQEICMLTDSAEFVICAGGGGLNEVLSRGKKTIALSLANNQVTQLQNAHFLPSVLTIFSHCNLEQKIQSSLQLLHKMPKPKPKELGYSLKPWIFKSILPLISAKNALHFSLLSHTQKLEVLRLRNQEEVRENCLDSRLITKKEHFNFIASLPFSHFFWAFFENENKSGEIIAIGSLILKSDTKALLGIYKNKNYNAIGKKILHSLFESAKKLNINTIELEVLKTNEKAILMYQKSNFHIIKEEKRTFIMEKKL